MEKQPINFSFRIYAKYLIRKMQTTTNYSERRTGVWKYCLSLSSIIYICLFFLMVELCCCLSTHLRSYVILVSWSPPHYKALISNSANILSQDYYCWDKHPNQKRLNSLTTSHNSSSCRVHRGVMLAYLPLMICSV